MVRNIVTNFSCGVDLVLDRRATEVNINENLGATVNIPPNLPSLDPLALNVSIKRLKFYMIYILDAFEPC